MDFLRPSTPRSRIGGLRGQLLIGLVVLLIVALALVAVATLQFHTRHLQQSKVDESLRHVRTLAAVDDAADRRQFAAALSTQPGIVYAGELPETIDPDTIAASQVWISERDGQSVVWATADRGAPMAVAVSLHDAQESVDEGRRALMLYLTLTLLFVSVVGYAFYSFVVIRPLRALDVATERAAKGDLASPITVLPRNEFGRVGRQFNQMLETLENQREELEDQLEQLQRAHRELQETQESLIRSEKMASVGHLAAGIAHEIGNPLAAVLGYTDLLRDRDLDEESADDLADRSIDQLKRIQNIIRQLLDYSRADSEREPSSVDVRAIIDEALHLVGATPEGRDMEVTVDVADDIAPAHAIAGELEQVLVNLVINAAEAMAADDSTPRRLRVDADVDGDQVVIDIIDTGPGIADDIADEIFDPFFTTRDPGDGTGLGLAIAHRLVARVDGQLLLRPRDGGAHFQIRLPVCDASTSA